MTDTFVLSSKWQDATEALARLAPFDGIFWDTYEVVDSPLWRVLSAFSFVDIAVFRCDMCDKCARDKLRMRRRRR